MLRLLPIWPNFYSACILTIFSFVFFQALEDDFAYQLEEQERHYGPYLNSALSAEAAAAEGRNSATPTERRGSQPSRKASSKSSGSERSAGSGSTRKSSVNDLMTSKYGTPTGGAAGAHHRHSGGYMHSGQRRLSASRHSLASRGSDLWFLPKIHPEKKKNLEKWFDVKTTNLLNFCEKEKANITQKKYRIVYNRYNKEKIIFLKQKLSPHF